MNDKIGWIYVMRSDSYSDNIFKIGKTKRKPDKRLKELSTSLSQNLEILFLIRVNDIDKAEQKVFQLLEDNRIEKKEIFEIYDFSMIVSVFKYVEQLFSLDSDNEIKIKITRRE